MKVNYGIKGDYVTPEQARALGVGWSTLEYEFQSAAGLTPPSQTPGPPTNLQGQPGDSQVSLSWTAPTAANGTIADYVVEYDGQQVYVGSTATSLVVTGLTNGVTYVFVVSAINENGPGERSSPSAGITPVGSAVSLSGFPLRTYALSANNPQPLRTWTQTATSAVFTFNGPQDVYAWFTLSGTTNVTNYPIGAGGLPLTSANQLGGGTLQKDGTYQYSTPRSSLNAGTYWHRTVFTSTTTTNTVSWQFASSVVTAAGINAREPLLSGATNNKTLTWAGFYESTNTVPAATASMSGSVISWRTYENVYLISTGSVFDQTNKLLFNVTGSSARQVTFTATQRPYPLRPLRSNSLNGNSGWILDKGGVYASTWTAQDNSTTSTNSWQTKTLTLNPGSYWLAIPNTNDPYVTSGSPAPKSGTITFA